jgi:CDP-glucose 4,6-dehydratase
VPGTIRGLLGNQCPIIRSDGKYIRDYIFVLDIVEAYMLLASKIPEDGIRGEAFNFSLESQVRVLEITHMIQNLMCRTELEPIILNEVKAEIKDQSLDSGKAKRLLNWVPRFSLEEGLIKTIEWYQDYFGVK